MKQHCFYVMSGCLPDDVVGITMGGFFGNKSDDLTLEGLSDLSQKNNNDGPEKSLQRL